MEDFWTWPWTVWVVPTFSVYFPKSIGHQKTLRLNLCSCFWTHLIIPHEKGKVTMINITTPACQHAIINVICLNTSLWIQTQLSMVFLLRASWCFDIREQLKETNLLPALGQDGCVESHSLDQIPHGHWATGPFWAQFPASCLFVLLSYPLHLVSQEPFLLRLLEIPLSVERHPSLALSSHFRQTWFNLKWIRQASQSFRRWEITTDWFRGRKYIDRKNVYALTSRGV